MKILIVCSGNFDNFNFQIHQAFIYEQMEAVKRLDANIHFDKYFIKGKGIKGYLKNLKKLKTTLHKEEYNYVHAHFAFSSLLANLQRRVPVITTFHGSDVNNPKNRLLSGIVELLSKISIYVSEDLLNKSLPLKRKNRFVIPCGVDLDNFKPASKSISRKKLGLDPDTIYVLFSSSFNNKVKNYPLAKAAVDKLNNPNIELIEFKNYDRESAAVLMNAVDLALMTSSKEGSPQFIKEALACNCRIVSTDVGDVRSLIENIEGCFITSFEVEDIAEKIKIALDYNKSFSSRDHIKHLNNKFIAEKVRDLYLGK